MADSVFCKNCGASITGEATSGDPTQRNPCPQCGSLARSFNLQLDPGVLRLAGDTVNVVVITYPERLLTAAQDLIANGEFSIAVVVAHMACEVSAERALSRAFVTKGIDYLAEVLEDLLPGYNLTNDRLRKLYNAVMGDQIQAQPFWQAFKESATRRNQVVHKGKIANQAEAEKSLKAASDLVAYLK